MNPKALPFALFLAISLAPLSPSRIFGENGEQPGTLMECISLGLKKSASVHAALVNVRAAEAGIREARRKRIPSIAASAAYTRLSEIPPPTIDLPPPFSTSVSLGEDIRDSYSLGVSVQQPLFTGFAVANGIEKARSSEEASRAEYLTKKRDLVFSIEDAYWSLVKALDSLDVIEANLSLTNEHLREVNDFYTHGLVTYNEVLSVELQLGNTSLMALDAENGIRIARERLNLLTGLPREAAFVPRDRPPEQLEAPGELSVLVERALELRPEIAALQHRIQAGTAGVALARSDWYPKLLLNGGYRYARPNPRIFPPEDGFSGSWEIGIVLSVDFGRWNSIAPYEEQATAQVEQLQDALTGLRDSITLEVSRGYLEVTKYGKQTQVALQMIKQSEESERIVRDKYRNGLALTTDLLDAELSLLRAKLTYSRARIDYMIGLASLRRATGMPRGEGAHGD